MTSLDKPATRSGSITRAPNQWQERQQKAAEAEFTQSLAGREISRLQAAITQLRAQLAQLRGENGVVVNFPIISLDRVGGAQAPTQEVAAAVAALLGTEDFYIMQDGAPVLFRFVAQEV